MEPGREQAGQHLDGARVHRALASPVRVRLLRLLLDPAGPRETRPLAAALELHVNTVRAHLAVLQDAGLVRSEAEERDRPGRPRLRYRPTETAAEVVEPASVAGVAAERSYRFLAQVLASHLASTAADPAAEARGVGAAWGRSLVDRPAPSERLDASGAIERVVALLAEFGFDPQPRASQVLLRRCPFRAVAEEQAEVVCSIHLGLMRGALDELGVELGVRDLRPFVEPGLCIAELELDERPPG